MSDLEPRDVGPRVGGDRPVGEADRRLVVELLEAAGADGRLRPDQVADRRTRALHAQTLDDLIPLTRDLMSSAPLPPPASPGPAAVYVNPPIGGVAAPSPAFGPPARPSSRPTAEPILAVFGAAVRKGAWSPPPAVTAVSAFGSFSIDLTKANWPGPEIEITVYVMCAGADIKVPAGTEVVSQVAPILGGVDLKGDLSRPGARRLVIKGVCLFGGVVVKAA